SRMDAATELTWTYLQRPLPPDPPRNPSGSQLLTLPLPLPLPLIAAGAGLQALQAPLPEQGFLREVFKIV
ncbi:hypothetical protein, partial [Stenotrophomonas sp. NPDC077659]|uniref:hypothetical protein n=1 Tax=Stenotrophomonas sp. NPDC077659 TaxID=3390694 RepID=UPI003D0026CB